MFVLGACSAVLEVFSSWQHEAAQPRSVLLGNLLGRESELEEDAGDHQRMLLSLAAFSCPSRPRAKSQLSKGCRMRRRGDIKKKATDSWMAFCKLFAGEDVVHSDVLICLPNLDAMVLRLLLFFILHDVSAAKTGIHLSSG